MMDLLRDWTPLPTTIQTPDCGNSIKSVPVKQSGEEINTDCGFCGTLARLELRIEGGIPSTVYVPYGWHSSNGRSDALDPRAKRVGTQISIIPI